MGADMIYNGCGFIVDASSMEAAAQIPQEELIHLLLNYGASSNPELTQIAFEAGLTDLAYRLKWSEDTELADLFVKIRKLFDNHQTEMIPPLVAGLGSNGYSAMLHGCRINTGVSYNLEGSPIFDGHTELLLKLIIQCPPEAEIDDSIKIENISKIKITENLNSSLGILSGFSELRDLEYHNASNLDGLTQLPMLESLTCTECRLETPFSEHVSLRNLYALEQLTFSGGSESKNTLEPFCELPNLKSLKVNYWHNLKDISPLLKLTKLEKLDLSHCYGLTDVSALNEHTGLKHLILNPHCVEIGLDNIKNMNLETLDLNPD